MRAGRNLQLEFEQEESELAQLEHHYDTPPRGTSPTYDDLPTSGRVSPKVEAVRVEDRSLPITTLVPTPRLEASLATPTKTISNVVDTPEANRLRHEAILRETEQIRLEGSEETQHAQGNTHYHPKWIRILILKFDYYDFDSFGMLVLLPTDDMTEGEVERFWKNIESMNKRGKELNDELINASEDEIILGEAIELFENPKFDPEWAARKLTKRFKLHMADALEYVDRAQGTQHTLQSTFTGIPTFKHVCC